MALDSDTAHLEEYDISDMGPYEIERLKWEIDENPFTHLPWSHDEAILDSTPERSMEEAVPEWAAASYHCPDIPGESHH